MDASKPRDPRAIAFVIIWILLLALAPKTMLRDPGTFWHTVVGERMLSTGAVVRTDSFTFTHAGDEWLAQQWLGECVMALVHRFAGLDGVVLLAATLIAAMLALIYGRLAAAGLNPFASIGLLIVVVGASSYHYIPRPHLATIAGMALLTMLLIDVESRRPAPKTLWLLPPMFLVWVNIHGGALGGLATLVIFTIVHLLRGRPTATHAMSPAPDAFASGRATQTAPAELPALSAAQLAVVTSLCAATVLINPFGPSLPRVWVSLMGSRVLPEVIIEHAPLSLLAPEGLMILALGGLYVFTLMSARQVGVRTAWMLPGVWLLLALSRVRHGPLFAVCAAVVLADMIPHVSYWQRWRRDDARVAESSSGRRNVRFAAVVASCFAAAFAIQTAGWTAPIVGAGRCRPTDDQWPVTAVDVLREDTLERRLPAPRVFNEMRFGGYLIYAMPEAAIYIDDRCELHRDVGLRRYVELQRHPERLVGETARFGFDYALVATDGPVCKQLMDGCDWLLIHTDATATLFKSRNDPARRRLAIARPPRQR